VSFTTRFALIDARGSFWLHYFGGSSRSASAGELEKTSSRSGLANVQAEVQSPGILDSVQYLLDIVRVLHPDLDVLVLSRTGSKAHFPDDFKNFSIDGL